MRSTSIVLPVLVLLLGHADTANGQAALLKRADRCHADFSYHCAAQAYESAFARSAGSPEQMRRLADSYWQMRDLQNAARWYGILAASPEATGQDVYRHAELVCMSGDHARYEELMDRYRTMAPEDSRGMRKSHAQDRLAALASDKGPRNQVALAAFSCEQADMTPFVAGDSILFASTRAPRFARRHIHSWNDQPFLDLYTGRLDTAGEVSHIKALRPLNTRYHESNAILSSDGRFMYFTRNYSDPQGGKRAAGQVNNLRIMIRERNGNKWGRETGFTHNNAAYSVGHPSLSTDGMLLYFTSDMPGGMGGKDLYVCHRQPDGTWGTPVNAGPVINTEGDEMFPFLHGNVLYFSSDGHLGLGGLDIFRTRLGEDGPGDVINLRAPINGPTDDFGLCLAENATMGFFTSDRNTSTGAENIYRFTWGASDQEFITVQGRAVDKHDQKAIPHLTVRMLDEDHNEIASTLTDNDGSYSFKAPRQAFIISANIPGGDEAELPYEDAAIELLDEIEMPNIFLTSVMDLPVNAIIRDAATDEGLDGVVVTVKDIRDGTTLFHGVTNELGITQGQIPDRRFGDDLNLEVSLSRMGYLPMTLLVDFRILMFLDQALSGEGGTGMTKLSHGADLAALLGLPPIQFGFNQDIPHAEAKETIERIAQVLKADPSIRVTIHAHTDSRGSDVSNKSLSERRARNTREKFIQHGVYRDQLATTGHGEERLLNHCGNGAACSEEEHAVNRRIEFIVDEFSMGGYLTDAQAPKMKPAGRDR